MISPEEYRNSPLLNGRQFFHGTNANLRPQERLTPDVANDTDYDYDDEGNPTPHPHTYMTTRAQTAARYGRNVYKVFLPGQIPAQQDKTMLPEAEAYKTDSPVVVLKKWAYRPPAESFDSGSLKNTDFRSYSSLMNRDD